MYFRTVSKDRESTDINMVPEAGEDHVEGTIA